MSLPELTHGLVVRYAYIWRERGRGAGGKDEVAGKDRPACVLLVMRRAKGGRSVLLLPITHTPPGPDSLGVEIPAKVKAHLGLDHERSWVIVSECNVDVWPNPDLQQIPNYPGRFHYGHLPPRLFRAVRDAFVAAHAARRVRRVDRGALET